jgi:hypothetical protein
MPAGTHQIPNELNPPSGRMRIAIRSCDGLNHHHARDENAFRRILRLLEAPVCATQIVENHPAAASHKYATNKDELHAPSGEANLRKGMDRSQSSPSTVVQSKRR